MGKKILKNRLIIRTAKEKDASKIKKFISLNFKKNHILVKNNKFFNWQFKNANKKINCTLALRDKEIIGIYFYVPLGKFDKKLNKKKHIFGSIWTVKGFNKLQLPKNHKSDNDSKNLLTNFNKEGVAIALKIFFKLNLSFEPKLLIGIGVAPRFFRFHIQKKFKLVNSNHHFIASPDIKKFKILKNNYFSKKNINKQIQRKINFKLISKANDLKKLNINKLFDYQIPTKSKDYLINRYLKHPIYKYYIYFISQKKINNICIFRIVKLKKTRVIRIIDYVGSNNHFPILKNFFFEILQKYKAEYLDFYSYGIPLNILKKAGLENKKNYKNLIIPDLFEPFVNKNLVVTIGYKKFDNKGFIRIFKGDGDQDRPTFTRKN